MNWYCFDCDKQIPKEEVINKPCPERGFNAVNSNYCKKCDCELGIFQTVTIKNCGKCSAGKVKIISNGRGKQKEFPCSLNHQNNPNQTENENNKYDWKPLLIGGGIIALIILLGWLFMRNKNKK